MNLDTIKSELFEQIKKQGLSFVVLCAVTYHFYVQVEKLELQVRQCEIEYRSTLLRMIDDNTRAIKTLGESLNDSE